MAGPGAFATAASATEDNASWMPEKWDDEADLVIVGFGGAGAAATITAASQGAKVLLLEKAPEGEEGGDTSCCAGTVDLGFRGGSQMTVEEYLYDTVFGVSQEDAEDYVAWENSIGDWFSEIGIPLYFSDTMGSQFASLRSYVEDESGITGNNGWVLFRELKRVVLEHPDNVKIYYETPVTELVQDPVTREVIGVKAPTVNGDKYFKGTKGVILACGDYAGDARPSVRFTLPVFTSPISVRRTILGTP